MIRGNDPILLTPGPLTTSLETKQAMLRDWGSWDAEFNALTARIRRELLQIAHADESHVVAAVEECQRERARLRFGAADSGEELLCDDDPHGRSG